MTKRIILGLLILLSLFPSCQNYTAWQGKQIIQNPPSSEEPPVVTKYSVLEAEKQGIKDEEERQKALLAEQQQQKQEALEREQLEQAIAEDKATIAGLNAKIATLEQEIKDEEERQEVLLAEQQLQKQEALEREQLEHKATIDGLNANIATLEQEILALKQHQSDLEGNLETHATEQSAAHSELEQLKEKQQELQTKLESATYHSTEVEGLLEEQRLINEHLSLVLTESEQNAAQALVQKQQEYNKTLAILETKLESLQAENTILKAQLEEKTLTLEEKLRLEQERENEAKRIEQERLQAQQEMDIVAQQKAEEEHQHLLALQAEYKQIPPLDALTFPRRYTTEEATIRMQEQDQVSVLLLPLDDTPWMDAAIVKEVHKSISDLGYPIIFVTGAMENVVDLVREMRRNAVLVEGGAIITSFAILDADPTGIRVQFSDKKQIRLSLGNLAEYSVLKAFEQQQDWQSVQKEVSPARIEKLKAIVERGASTDPTILGASLFEPSHQDWNTFSPIPYRQIDYLWPLTSYLEEAQFYDVYRSTHFSADTDAGNTLLLGTIKERVDYLFSRKVLPLSSSILTIGGESVEDENGLCRYALAASFLIP